MNLTIEHKDNFTIVTIHSNKIDSGNSPDLKAKLLIEAQPDIKALLVDISQVESIDSSGFGAFLIANRQLASHNIPTYIVGANKSIMHLFEILKLDRVFEFSQSVESVIATMQNI